MRRRKRLPTGWLRRAQEARVRTDEKYAERGPVSNLPVPDGDAERITAAELEESS